jgi:hypothetical protein
MSQAQVEGILGPPCSVETKDPSIHGTGRQVLVYFKRLNSVRHFPMLWVHLKDGRVEEVYGKRHLFLESEGVFGLSSGRRWESIYFERTFPSTQNGA